MKTLLTAVLFFLLSFSPEAARACACGCGIFDVGTASMLPNSSGAMAYFQFDSIDQNQSRNGASAVSAGDNPNRQIRTLTTTLGAQMMWNREHGIQVDVPYVFRRFQTVDSVSGQLSSFDSSSVGDIRIRGIYAGFSPDMTTGLTYGLKLPTGKTDAAGLDHDIQIGSGSTDLLVGLYHFGSLSEDRIWNSFVQTNLTLPVLTHHGFIPGHELAAAYGVFYSGVPTGPKLKFTPMAQIRATLKAPNSGNHGHSDETGYSMLLAAPAMELAFSGIRIYTDAAFPIYRYFNGTQLAPPVLLKTVVAFYF